MTIFELFALNSVHDPVVLCKDGIFGVLITYPRKSTGTAGVQVPGEQDMRQINPHDLEDRGGGALAEYAAPHDVVAAKEVMGAQSLLCWTWCQLRDRHQQRVRQYVALSIPQRRGSIW